jgi:flagellar export protein FliJ
MADQLRVHTQRLKRLLQIRQTLANAAEAQVHESSERVFKLENAQQGVTGQIQSTLEEIAYSPRLSGIELHLSEKFIRTLYSNRQSIKENLEKAKDNLEVRRRQWREAMSELKVVEKIQDRRLQELSRKDEVANQKSMDDAFIVKLVRSRTNG